MQQIKFKLMESIDKYLHDISLLITSLANYAAYEFYIYLFIYLIKFGHIFYTFT